MSLKSRIEALIYAAEEPVTLAQLASLLKDEALPLLATPETEAEATPEAAVTATEHAAEPAPENGPAPETEAAAPEALSEDAAGAAEEEKKAAREKEKAAEKALDRRIRDLLRTHTAELIADYANSERGMEIREVAGGYRMSTKPEYHDTIRAFVKSLKPPLKLSLQALETLAVVAYKQPVTAPEISEIRGVDSGGVLGSLITRKLITTAGRKQVIGRPILYKTTRDFLLRFGLKDISELPSIEEFEKLAGELTDVVDEATDAAETTMIVNSTATEADELAGDDEIPVAIDTAAAQAAEEEPAVE